MHSTSELKSHCRYVGEGIEKMVKAVLAIVAIVVSPICAYAHGSAEMHYNDIACVLDGFGKPDYYDAKESWKLVTGNGFSPNAAASTIQSEKGFAGFYGVVSQVSSRMDSMPRELEAKLGLKPMTLSHPRTHRFICHGWTIDGNPPDNVLKLFEMKTGLDKSVLVKEWKAYQEATLSLVQEYTRLPLEKSKAFAGIIWDIHLLGDWTPDNSEVKWLVRTQDIMEDMRKNLKTLMGERGEKIYERLAKAIKPLFDKGVADRDVAVQIMKILKEQRIGSAIYLENKQAMRGLWNSDVAVNVNNDRATIRVQEKITRIGAAKESARAKVRPATARNTTPKDLVDDVSKNCKKSRVVEMQSRNASNNAKGVANSSRQIIAKDVAELKKMEGELLKKNPKVTKVRTVVGVMKKVESESGKEGVALVVPASAVDSGVKVAAKAAAVEGCVAFVFSEGYAVCAYAYGGMSEDEFYRVTVKNVTASSVVAGATFVAVMLGAAPGGPVVMAVGIAGYILVDLAFEAARSSPFTLEDVLGITDDILADAYGFLDPKKDPSFLDEFNTPSYLNPKKERSFLDPPKGKSFLDGL